MAVDVTTEPSFSAGKPRVLLTAVIDGSLLGGSKVPLDHGGINS